MRDMKWRTVTFLMANERMLDDARRNGETVVMTITSHPEMPICHSGKSEHVSREPDEDRYKLTPDTDTERGEDGPEDELCQVSNLPLEDSTPLTPL